MNKPLLVIFVAVSGSGKTYFATRLAEKNIWELLGQFSLYGRNIVC